MGPEFGSFSFKLYQVQLVRFQRLEDQPRREVNINKHMEETTKIAIFRGRKIRKTIYRNEWWFVIVDVVSALTDSVQPDGYIKDMRRRDPELSK